MSTRKTSALVLGLALLFSGITTCLEASTQTTRNVLIRIDTSKGAMFAELYPQKAPITVQNFLSYVDEGFYSNTIFHRVYKNFVVQGGGYTASLVEKTSTRNAIQNEATNQLSNKRGTLAMARLLDPHSATNQFFINTKDNPRLNYQGSSNSQYGYAVFGKLIHGWDVLDAIEAAPISATGLFEHLPIETIVINSISVLNRN